MLGREVPSRPDRLVRRPSRLSRENLSRGRDYHQVRLSATMSSTMSATMSTSMSATMSTSLSRESLSKGRDYHQVRPTSADPLSTDNWTKVQRKTFIELKGGKSQWIGFSGKSMHKRKHEGKLQVGDKKSILATKLKSKALFWNYIVSEK